jgi:hypothetical protein
MHKKLLLIFALTILIASTLIGCSQVSSTPSTLTILSITEGDVFVMKAGTDNWVEADVGISLEPGDSIKTGDSSGAEITFFDGSTIELEADTEIKVVSLDISPDTDSKTITLEQTIGTTISRVTKLLDPASSYEIETPTGVAAVRGSTMIVTVTHVTPQIINTWTTNQEGNIWFIGQGVELQVPEGQTCLSISGELPELISLAQDDTAITDEDNPVTVVAPGVLNNDSDPHIGNTLSVTSVNTSGTMGAVTAWNADGSFTYDPNGQFEYLQAGSSTTDSFTYTVSNSNGGTDTATVTVTINGVNDIPTDINLDNSSVAEDQYYGTMVGNFSTTDPDTGDTFTYSLVSGNGDDNNTSFMIVDSQLQTINSFDYETKNYCSIRVRSTDSGMLHYEESFIITITNVNEPPVNYPPVAVDDSDTTRADTSVTIDVLSNDSDIDGDTLIVDSVTQGTSGSVTNNGNDVTYTPDPYFTGTDSFTYTVSDGNGGTDIATVTVTVTNVNNPPAAVDDSDNTRADTSVTIDVLSNDSDIDGDTLTVDSVTQGTSGSVTNNGNDVTYTPDPYFTGTDSFTYTVSDGNGGTDIATVTVTVTNVNNPPVASDDSATTPQDTPVTIDVLSNDSDIDGDTLTVDSVTQGTSGSVTNSGNDVTYTPNSGFTGTDSFTYTISDGNGGTDTATVTVTVTVIETTARIRITVDQGPIAPIYVQDTTTSEMVVDGNVVASATIQVAGEHSYCVWVGGDATRYVNSCPDSWSGVGTETACGKAAIGVMHPVHFTQSTPS